jgi:hypothetical protein
VSGYFVLAHHEARRRALAFVAEAPEGWTVRVQEPKRNLDQNAKFHAICADLARSEQQWAGKRRTAAPCRLVRTSERPDQW